ncbi:MAG: phage integrase SAM-like domain-containing protein [Bacteroidota bacterium]
MTKVKAILWTYDQTTDGRYPIKIRISKDRKYRYIPTEKYCFKNEWDEKEGAVKKPHKNIGYTNAVIDKKLSDVKEIVNKALVEGEELTLDQIANLAKRKSAKVSFFEFGADRIRGKLIRKEFSTANAELSILTNIHTFRNARKDATPEAINEQRLERISSGRSGKLTPEERLQKLTSDPLLFENIDEKFIKDFKHFCASILGQKTRTISNQLILVRTLFNQAIKEKLVNPKSYPFGSENEKIKLPSSNKIGLTKEEVGVIESLELDAETSIWHARNVWLFSFYFAGVRISDVVKTKWHEFIDGRYQYVMNKNEKPVSLAIPEKAQAILDLYIKDKKSNNDYVFPFLKKANQSDERDVFRKTRNATKLLNKYLKRIADMCDIEKNISNHISRHTFGNIAGDAIHPLMLQKLYRHGDLKTTINYQKNFIHKDADEALLKVVN